MSSCKQLRMRVEKLDELWVAKIYVQPGVYFGSKAGLWTVRSSYVKQVDFKNLINHNRAIKTVKEAKDTQITQFKRWLVFTAVMITVSQPLMCILRYDLKVPITNAVLLVPCTVCWCALLLNLIFQSIQSIHKYKKVTVFEQ